MNSCAVLSTVLRYRTVLCRAIPSGDCVLYSTWWKQAVFHTRTHRLCIPQLQNCMNHVICMEFQKSEHTACSVRHTRERNLDLCSELCILHFVNINAIDETNRDVIYSEAASFVTKGWRILCLGKGIAEKKVQREGMGAK